MEPPIKHDVDMEAYDKMMEDAGFEFVDGTDEEIELIFLASPDEKETPEPEG